MDERFGTYEIVRRLGRGRMTKTFLAVRRGPGELERRVCLEWGLPGQSGDPSFERMLLDQAKMTASLRQSKQNNDFWVPATTTCEGYLTFRDDGCEAGTQDFCGHDGNGGHADGCCVGGGPTRCTYPCTSDTDCPGSYDCGGEVGGYCDVN